VHDAAAQLSLLLINVIDRAGARYRINSDVDGQLITGGVLSIRNVCDALALLLNHQSP
jgi:hypothetical protein